MEFSRKAVSNIPEAVRAKWSTDVLIEGFTPFPKRLLRCLGKLFTGEKAVLELQAVLAVTDYLRPNMSRGPSMEYLAFIAGLPVEELATAFESLKGKGFLTVQGTNDVLRLDLSGLAKEIEKLTPDAPSSEVAF